MTAALRLIDRIEAEMAELRHAADTAARHRQQMGATRLQGKADGLRWVLKTMAEIREEEARGQRPETRTEVESLVKGGRA